MLGASLPGDVAWGMLQPPDGKADDESSVSDDRGFVELFQLLDVDLVVLCSLCSELVIDPTVLTVAAFMLVPFHRRIVVMGAEGLHLELDAT